MQVRLLRIISLFMAVLLAVLLPSCNKTSAPGNDSNLSTSKNDSTESTTAPTTTDTSDTVDTDTNITDPVEDTTMNTPGTSKNTNSSQTKKGTVGTVKTKSYTVNGIPRAYLTDAINVKFVRQDESYVKVYDKSKLNKSSGTVIDVDTSKTYQTIDGFGASITDTAAFVMYEMPEEERNSAMEKLFDRNKGIGLSMIRNCIGSSDFAREYYTYNDLPEGEEDWNLEKFDISHDLKQIIPLTKQAISINQNIKLIASPWTAPLWMKTEWTFIGTNKPMLRRECYQVYANYLVKFIQEYQRNGVPVFAITPQNEPHALVPWPGMYFDWESEAIFVSEYLRPALNKAGLKTKVLVWDHNWDEADVANAIMSATLDSADGVAYHWYGGEPEDMNTTSSYFPDKLIYVTEASSSNGNPNGIFRNISSKIIRSLRSNAKGYILWNLALDENGGPTYNNINNHCTGLVVANREKKKIFYNPDYYALAHFSKFIHLGAVRVYSTETGKSSDSLTNIVCVNPNGTMTAVVINGFAKDIVTKLVIGDKVIEVNIPKLSGLTLTWDANV